MFIFMSTHLFWELAYTCRNLFDAPAGVTLEEFSTFPPGACRLQYCQRCFLYDAKPENVEKHALAHQWGPGDAGPRA